MAVNSTSSSSSSNWASMFGIKNNGIGGLVSGLDTDSLVQALTSGTKAKIAKQGQDKQLLNWKMTAYRSMSTALKAFQKKSFDYNTGTNTNIMSSGFFNTYKTTSSSSKITATAGVNATLGTFTIDSIQQLATSETLSSKTHLSTDLMLGGLTNGQAMDSNAFSGETLKLDYNGTVKTVKLDSLNSAIVNGKLDITKFEEGLQGLLDQSFSTKKVYSNTGAFTSTAGKYDVVSNVQVSVVDVDVTDDDGITTTVKQIKLNSDSAKLTIATDNDLLGIHEGDSSRVSLNTKIGRIDAFANVEGNVLKFNINGTEISVNKNESLNTLMLRINSSDAGVRMSYSESTDQFTLTSKATGGGENIVLRDVQGNLMNELFGAQGGNGIGTAILTTANTAVSQNQSKFFGLESGSSDMKSIGSSLKYMMFDMTINGVTKTVKVDSSVIDTEKLNKGTFTSADVYSAINKGITTAFGPDAGVSLYDAGNGKTGISTGAGVAASIDNGGIMDLLGFTKKTGNSVIDLDYNSTVQAANQTSAVISTTTTATMSMTINGVTKQLELKGFNYMSGDDALNSAIRAAFGDDIAKNVKFSADFIRNPDTQAKNEDGSDKFDENGDPVMVAGAIIGAKLKLNVSDPSMAVSFGSGTTQNGKVDLFREIGFSTQLQDEDGIGLVDENDNPVMSVYVDNRKANNNSMTFGALASGTGLSNADDPKTLTINDGTNTFTVSYSKDTKLQDFMTEINSKSNGAVSAAIIDGQLRITSKSGTIDITDSGSLLKDMFGIADGNYSTAVKNIPEGNRVEGKNAEFIIDGAVYSRASNTNEINGVTFTLNQVSEAGDAPIKIGVESDPTDVINRIQSWMDDYNALIYTLNSAVNESKNGDYFPLTDDQKSGMTEDQIKTWEAEAKKGVLRNDSALKQILADLRASLYEKVESVGLSLYDLGITTKSYTDPNEAGQIEFTPSDKSLNRLSGEDKLRKLLETDPDKVRLFFTDSSQGLAVKMNNIIDKAANTSSVNRGSLVRLAGTDILTGDNTSTLGNKISAIDKYIASLKTRMESEYNRYWKKFSALELAVQKMSSQSSWLSQS